MPSSILPLPQAAASPAVAGHQPLLLAIAVAACFAVPAQAQPTGAQAIQGAVSLSQQGNKLTVTTQNGAGTNHSAINWQSFSIPAGQITQFNQPSASSTSINRVVTNNPSAIFGTLSSNGRLVLVNPSGIAVGAGAVVDTAGFTASTLRMSDADALAGRLRFEGGSNALTVGGQILARNGDVVLIAPNVETAASALIQSPNGATILAAGQKAELTGRGLEGISLQLQAPDNSALNLGVLTGDAVGMFAGTLKHSGLISANAVTVEGGKVVLKARGDALVDGQIAATAGPKGGSIDVLGQRVALFGAATLNASGTTGGGQVRIGGDYQGANAAVPNASHTFVGESASIRADATQNGDGGRVIVWSDEMTRMQGKISARGGEQGGNGGFAEVSGKGLEFTGRVDLRAPQGTTGTLLLDPYNIEISSAPSTIAPAAGPGPDYTFTGGSGDTVLKVADLETQLGLGNVRVVTAYTTLGAGSGQISVNNDVSWSSGNTLALSAINGITLNANVKGETGGSVSSAYGSLILATTYGDITQGAGKTIKVDQLSAQSDMGNVSLTQANQVNTLAGRALNGTFDFKNAQALAIGTVTDPFTSAMTGLESKGKLSVQTTSGNLSTSAYVKGGSVELKAASSINAAAAISTRGSTDSMSTTEGAVNLNAQGGSVTFSSIATTGAIAAPHGGPVNVTASTYIYGTSIDSSGYGSSSGSNGGNAGAVALTSGTGSSHYITLLGGISAIGGDSAGASAGSGSGGNGGLVKLSAGGNISVNGTIGTIGGYSDYDVGGKGGDLSLSSSGGNIVVAGIDTSAYSSNSSLGASSGGMVRLEASTTVNAGNILTSGGINYGNGNAGDGGDVIVIAGGAVSIGSSFGIRAQGGNASVGSAGGGGDVSIISTTGGISITTGIDTKGGNGSVGAGGGGGSVELKVLSGALTLGSMTIASGGGNGGVGMLTGGQGGKGGKGGNILARSETSTINASGATINADGGSGGLSYGEGSSDRGGHGGDAGNVVFQASGEDSYVGSVNARGGDGGGAPVSGTSKGGNGGKGGNVSVSLTSPPAAPSPAPAVVASLTLSGLIHNEGGLYGMAAPAPSPAPAVDPGRFGAMGGNGVFTASVPGGVSPGSTVDTTGVPAAGGVHVQPGFTVYGNWANPSVLKLFGGTNLVKVYGQFSNTGTVLLGPNATLDVGTRSENSFLSGGGTLLNSGTIRGNGTLKANVTNTGTVAPQAYGSYGSFSAQIGKLTVQGDFANQGTLQMQVVDPAVMTPTGGVHYDQIVVTGETTLGGALLISAYTPPAPAASAPLEPMAEGLFMPMSATDYNVIDAQGGVAPGSAFSTFDAPAAFQSLVTVGGGPVPTTAPPPPPPPPTVSPPPPTAAPPVPTTAPPTTAPPPPPPTTAPPPPAQAPAVQAPAVQETGNQVVAFLDLIDKFINPPVSDEKDPLKKKTEDIVITDTQCKP